MTVNNQIIRGGRELDELLKTLPDKLQKNIVRGMVRAGAAEFLPIVKAKIPVDQGDLQASARITTRAQKDGKITASVKVGNKIAWYAKFVEYGTRPHLISVNAEERGVNRRTGKALSMTTVNRRALQIGQNFVGASVQHPGAKPHPFMRPAADEGFAQAIQAAEKKLRQRLTKQGLNVPEPLPPEPAE